MADRRPGPAALGDAALAARVAERDVDAWSELYDRYAPAVYATAAHMLGRDHAEEIVQEAFLRLWHKAEQYDATRGTFAAWLLAIVRHRVCDELRHRGIEERLLVAGDVEQLIAETSDPVADVEDAVARRERGTRVLRALRSLPPEQRRVLVLAYFGGGLTQRSIAEYLGWPLGTVKKRTTLGLEKLRVQLAAYEPGDRGVREPGARHEL
jgi:RNA polymerase sigma-70 factor, ECF subfamily